MDLSSLTQAIVDLASLACMARIACSAVMASAFDYIPCHRRRFLRGGRRGRGWVRGGRGTKVAGMHRCGIVGGDDSHRWRWLTLAGRERGRGEGDARD